MIVFSPLWIKIKVTDPDYFSFTLLLWLKLPLLVTVIRKSPPCRKWHRFPSRWVCLVCFRVDKAREGFISGPSVFPPALTTEPQFSPTTPHKTRSRVLSGSSFSPSYLFLPSFPISQSSCCELDVLASWPEDLQLTYIAVGTPFHFKDKPTLLHLRLF